MRGANRRVVPASSNLTVFFFLVCLLLLYVLAIYAWGSVFRRKVDGISPLDDSEESRIGGLAERFMISKLRKENPNSEVLQSVKMQLENSQDREKQLHKQLENKLSDIDRMKKEIEALHKRNQVLTEEIEAPTPAPTPRATRAPTPSPTKPGNQFPIVLPNVPDDDVNRSRRNVVREAFRHSWRGYKQDAWGHDELQPLTHSGRDWIGAGTAATIVDGMDTAYVMGLDEEYREARDWLAENLRWEGKMFELPFFETTIRLLGGLVSGYELSGDDVLRQRADDLGRVLIHAFETNTGLPSWGVNLQTLSGRKSGTAVLSEVGSAQLEFNSLSYMTNNATYFDKPMHVFKHCKELGTFGGLYPLTVYLDVSSWGPPEFSFGGLGDSFYEYLLKVHLQTGDPELRQMYDDSVDGCLQTLIKKSVNGLTYLSDTNSGTKMEHLTCFAGGMFALGAQTMDPSRPDYEWRFARDMQLAVDLTLTCHEMYARMPTGIAPEDTYWNVNVGANNDNIPDFSAGNSVNIQRPETMETLFYMWRFTHDQKYRDWGWEIMEAFEKHEKVPSGGYSGLSSVTSVPAPQDNVMQSFWLAETLKYAYLLFSDDDVLPLNEWVFNTEAHPVRVRPTFKHTRQ